MSDRHARRRYYMTRDPWEPYHGGDQGEDGRQPLWPYILVLAIGVFIFWVIVDSLDWGVSTPPPSTVVTTTAYPPKPTTP